LGGQVHRDAQPADERGHDRVEATADEIGGQRPALEIGGNEGDILRHGDLGGRQLAPLPVLGCLMIDFEDSHRP